MSENTTEPITDRNELKIMALRERVAGLTAEYEDKIAELRIDLTLVSQELESLKNAQGAEAPAQQVHDVSSLPPQG